MDTATPNLTTTNVTRSVLIGVLACILYPRAIKAGPTIVTVRLSVWDTEMQYRRDESAHGTVERQPA